MPEATVGTVSRSSGAGLRAHGIRKAFAGVPALRGVDLTIAAGEIVGLVGHNGAGKSTLLRAIAGATPADAGTITLDGVEVDLSTPAQALAQGISTVYQELSLLPNLTVTQNVFLGRELRRRGLVDGEAMRRAARELVQRFHLEVDVDRRLGDYPVATRQLLEIAVAVFRDARFLLLDEPTTSLEASQVEHLLAFLSRAAEETGLGVLLVNHKLDELYAVADTIVALVDGEVRVSGAAGEIGREEIVAAIAGEAAAVADRDEGGDHRVDPARIVDADPSLEVRGLHGAALHGVDLAAYAGRVLGIYGLVGAGRTELLRTLVGLDPATGGSITLDGAPYRPRSPHAAQRQGLVYLTEERKTDGIVPLLDASTNVLLPVLHRFSKGGVLRRRAMRDYSAELMDQLKVRGNREAPVVGLSGGNQQKVLMARVLAQQPRVVLLDEPTKGVDIAVKSEIHRLLRRLAHDDGLTVVVVSSEEEEILEVADDVAVLVAGHCDGTTTLASHLTVPELRSAAWAAA